MSEEIDKRLLAYLQSWEKDQADGVSLRKLARRLEDSREDNRKDHDEFRRRFAEHGRRIGALETDVAALSDDVEEVEQVSKTHNLREIEKAEWWKRQGALWVVGAAGGLAGMLLSFIIGVVVYLITRR